MHGIRILALSLAVLAAAGLAGRPAIAMSSKSDSGASASAVEDDWSKAKRAIADKDYEAAVPLLKLTVQQDPKNADAYNYLGYSHAREGKSEEALGYYRQALAIKPDHRGANEYLGELYLKLGDLAHAEERLKVLDEACFFGCAEYDALKKAVAIYKETGKFTSTKGF